MCKAKPTRNGFLSTGAFPALGDLTVLKGESVAPVQPAAAIVKAEASPNDDADDMTPCPMTTSTNAVSLGIDSSLSNRSDNSASLTSHSSTIPTCYSGCPELFCSHTTLFRDSSSPDKNDLHMIMPLSAKSIDSVRKLEMTREDWFAQQLSQPKLQPSPASVQSVKRPLSVRFASIKRDIDLLSARSPKKIKMESPMKIENTLGALSGNANRSTKPFFFADNILAPEATRAASTAGLTTRKLVTHSTGFQHGTSGPYQVKREVCGEGSYPTRLPNILKYGLVNFPDAATPLTFRSQYRRAFSAGGEPVMPTAEHIEKKTRMPFTSISPVSGASRYTPTI